MPAKDQKITHDNKVIKISRLRFNCVAFAPYTKNLYDIITSTTWTVTSSTSKTKKKYLKSKKYGLLHQLIIKHFYGEDTLNEAYKIGFVIDHLNNDGFDCRYENLALISKRENSAKGLTYDIEREESIWKFAINITKDFDTKEFQVSMAFNQPTIFKIEDTEIQLAALYLRYGIDYKEVLIDARSIINDLNENMSFNLVNLRHKGFDYKKAEWLCIKNGEMISSGLMLRDGKLYIIQGSQGIYVRELCHNKELHK